MVRTAALGSLVAATGIAMTLGGCGGAAGGAGANTGSNKPLVVGGATPPRGTRDVLTLRSGSRVAVTRNGRCVVLIAGYPSSWGCYNGAQIDAGRALVVVDDCHSGAGVRTVFGLVPPGVRRVLVSRAHTSGIVGRVASRTFALQTHIGPHTPRLETMVWIGRDGRQLASHAMPEGLPPGCRLAASG